MAWKTVLAANYAAAGLWVIPQVHAAAPLIAGVPGQVIGGTLPAGVLSGSSWEPGLFTFTSRAAPYGRAGPSSATIGFSIWNT